MSENRRAELATFLETHRSRLRPADVGLPAHLVPGRRRTPGLRREEVAELAGARCRLHSLSVQLTGRDAHEGSL
ncbi:hypothetical protein [Nocardia asteroides]|uniref:hypothetical protein n=1 Tax=Nocardia asteroides TaxID=1824 RepID=UPI003F4D599D